MEPPTATTALEENVEAVASALSPPERYEIDSDRFDWPLDQTAGVPGLPAGVAIMPSNGSHAAALVTPCGSGKTYSVCRAAVPISETRLIVVTTCNRLFTTATNADWEAVCGENNVFCYLDGLGKGDTSKAAKRRLREMCDRGHGIIFISIESFLMLNGILDPSTVGLLLLEETSELASKMLSETCKCVRPFRLLREVASGAERVMYTDADFEADGPNNGRCHRLAKYICPSLPLRIFTLSRRVAHSMRSVKLFLDHPSAVAGLDFNAWWAQLRANLKAWKRTGDASGNRVACALATLDLVRRVCTLAKELGLHWCEYTSATSDHVKSAELAEPAKYWVEVGLVAFTQSLSVGVDPQNIEFAAVFLYVQPYGCSVRCQFQGGLRFGRDANFPLKCNSVFLCIKGCPLQGDALARQDGRMDGTTYFERGLAIQQQKSQERMIQERSMGRAVVCVGSRAGDSHLGKSCRALRAFGSHTSPYVEPTEEELGIAAWSEAELLEQKEDIYSVVKRTCLRHGWIENDAALDAQAADAFNKLETPEREADPIALFLVSVDQQVSSLMDKEEKIAWALAQLRSAACATRIDEFYLHCFGIGELSFRSAAEKVFLRTWMLLRRLPRGFFDTVTVAELMHLDKRSDAIELHALGICVGGPALLATEAVERDRAKSKYGAERHSRRLAQASQLKLFDELAQRLLTSSVSSFFVAPGEQAETIQAARPEVVRCLESARKGEDSVECDQLLYDLRDISARLGIARGKAEGDGLAVMIRRLLREAYIDMDLRMKRSAVPLQDESEAEEGSSSNDRRRAILVQARGPLPTPGPQRKKPKREEQIVGAVFKRHQISYPLLDAEGKFVYDEEGQMVEVTRDFALDWTVESPHACGLFASAREWLVAHSGQAIPLPSELRRALEDDLGIDDEEPLHPPGEGPYEDRPTGNASSSGTLYVEGATTAQPPLPSPPVQPATPPQQPRPPLPSPPVEPAAPPQQPRLPAGSAPPLTLRLPPKPRTTAEGFIQRDEMLPWKRLKELIAEVRRLIPLSAQHDERSWLKRGLKTLRHLERDAESLSEDANGMKWKPTFYGRRMPIGRLTATGSSMQPMPNLLRQWLYRGLLHDLDLVNAHPTILLGFAKMHRPQTWQRDVPVLVEYVGSRHDFLDRIVRWYGLPSRDFAKTAILVVINGGDLRYWRTKVKSPVSPLKPDLPELGALRAEALWIRDSIVFVESFFAPLLPPLLDRLHVVKRRVTRTEEEHKRSALSYVLGHVESMALEAACLVLEQHGFVLTSLIFDGGPTTHNPGGDLSVALAEAKVAVAKAVGFEGLEFKEKDMFYLGPFSLSHDSRDAAIQAVIEADMDDEGD